MANLKFNEAGKALKQELKPLDNKIRDLKRTPTGGYEGQESFLAERIYEIEREITKVIAEKLPKIFDCKTVRIGVYNKDPLIHNLYDCNRNKGERLLKYWKQPISQYSS